MSSDKNNLLLHKATRLQIKNFINKPNHGLLITGEKGSGKTAVAKYIASTLLNIQDIGSTENYSYFYHLKSVDGREISIEEIRKLIGKLKLKTPGDLEIKRVVLIEEANFLSIEAQNALLKTLEEPALDTVIILTVVSDRQILPTIASRTQYLHVSPIGLVEAEKYFADKFSKLKIDRFWRLSGGNAGLLLALCKDDNNHPLKIAVDNAKLFLKSDKYGRLLLLDKTTVNQSELYLFMDGLSRVLNFLSSNAYEKNQKNAATILKGRKFIIEMCNKADSKVNVKLVKLNLIMNINI